MKRLHCNSKHRYILRKFKLSKIKSFVLSVKDADTAANFLTQQTQPKNQVSMRQTFFTDICIQLGAINLSSEDLEENWTGSLLL